MIRILGLVLGLALAAPATAFEVSDMSPEERLAFEEAVRAYLLEHPEVIFEAVEVYEQRQAALQAQGDIEAISANAEAIFEDGVSWVGGNPEGDVTVVEFLDYRCGYCRKAFEEVRELVEGDGDIRFIVKEFPILGEESTLAAQFAIAVRNLAGPDVYEKVHNYLMTMRANVTPEVLAAIAAEHGLDMAEVQAAMESEQVESEIRANYALARALNISGTPGFVFQNEMLRGYAPLQTMQEIVSRVRG